MNGFADSVIGMGARRIADRITDTRRRYSQSAIGEALGLTQSSVSARLGGRIEWRREELRALADHLKVPLEELVADFMADDPAAPPSPRAGAVAEHLARPVEQVGSQR